MVRSSEPAGLYLHVPFCLRRCPFCSFAITTNLRQRDEWAGAILREIRLRAIDWPGAIETIYFGGGTPSLLSGATVGTILQAIRQSFHILPNPEVTLEANPGDLGSGDLDDLRALGINRFSLGVQSFDSADLELLGREHTVADSYETFDLARRAGFTNITIDLIYGLPQRDSKHWARQLEEAIALEPEHISPYLLSFEPGTLLGRRLERGEVRALTDAESEGMFLLTHETLTAAGYVHYEVSSYAREDRFQSRHNRKYWQGAPYLGVGPAAHSFLAPRRWWNVSRTTEYVRRLERGESAVEAEEALDIEQRQLERLFLGLRNGVGVDFASFEREFGLDLRTAGAAMIRELVAAGFADHPDTALRLTARGLARADAIALELSRRLQ